MEFCKNHDDGMASKCTTNVRHKNKLIEKKRNNSAESAEYENIIYKYQDICHFRTGHCSVSILAIFN